MNEERGERGDASGEGNGNGIISAGLPKPW